MALGKIFGVLVVLSLAATGAAVAGDMSNGTACAKGNSASIKGNKAAKADKEIKGNKATAKCGLEAVSVRHVKPQAPIVMGRSVGVYHKTKLHHVKIKPLDTSDIPVAADSSN